MSIGSYLASAAEQQRQRDWQTQHRNVGYGLQQQQLDLYKDRWLAEKELAKYEYEKARQKDIIESDVTSQTLKNLSNITEWEEEGKEFFEDRYDPKGDMWERRRAKRAGEDYNSIWQILGGNIAGSWRKNIKDPLLGQHEDYEKFKKKPEWEDNLMKILEPAIKKGLINEAELTALLERNAKLAGGKSEDIKTLLDYFNIDAIGEENQ